jgi:hypothetical protein
MTIGDATQRGTGRPSPDDGRLELPLPDPYPEYLACPACGEPEVEVWSNEGGARCHACGAWVDRRPESKVSPEKPD